MVHTNFTAKKSTERTAANRPKQAKQKQTGQTEANRPSGKKIFFFLYRTGNRMPGAWFWKTWWLEKIAEKPPFTFGFFD